MEIRRRKVIRGYAPSDSVRTCKRPRVYDPDAYSYRRHPQTYRIIETREPLRSKLSLNTLWRRESSPVRSQPFKMRLPYIKLVSPTKDAYEPKPRGRSRSPRLLVVDPPSKRRYTWPKNEREEPLSPEIRCISPRRQSSPRKPLPGPSERERRGNAVSVETQRQSRSLERPRGPRPPRERTPVIEREPVKQRQRHIARDVQIHQSPEREKRRSGSSGRRQVRFSEDIDYAEYRTRSWSESDDGFRDEGRRRACDVDDRPRYSRPSPERITHRKASPSRSPRAEVPVGSSLTSGRGRGRLRPRIIRDGDREISEAGDRIYAEARRRRSQERVLHDLTSHSDSRWRPRFDRTRDSCSEDRNTQQPLPSDTGHSSDANFTMDVFEISPDTALGLLCVAMDKLAQMATADRLRADASALREGSRGEGVSSGEETPTQMAELHFTPACENPLGRDLIQESILSKRFLSKREPPITLKEYLLRLHRYCPMSTGVYLATSLYITRMAYIDRIISVNRKNVHRLVLAGLRVAMKTLEDLSYSHSRVAKVGGVTERELSKLEISFCFLADFELRVDKQMLTDQARVLQLDRAHGGGLDLETGF
ncbi:cyclin-domain-containing protein [Aspergillus egyptiacus]|nr:cyclin-domain-containing protein [Aspergillus egyptiacus]